MGSALEDIKYFLAIFILLWLTNIQAHVAD